MSKQVASGNLHGPANRVGFVARSHRLEARKAGGQRRNQVPKSQGIMASRSVRRPVKPAARSRKPLSLFSGEKNSSSLNRLLTDRPNALANAKLWQDGRLTNRTKLEEKCQVMLAH
jgi:hypothetical protein